MRRPQNQPENYSNYHYENGAYPSNTNVPRANNKYNYEPSQQKVHPYVGENNANYRNVPTPRSYKFPDGDQNARNIPYYRDGEGGEVVHDPYYNEPMYRDGSN